MAKEVIGVPMEKNTGEVFCEVVRNVNEGINLFKADEVAFHPFAQSKILNVNVPCSGSGFGALPMAVQLSLFSYATVPILGECQGPIGCYKQRGTCGQRHLRP